LDGAEAGAEAAEAPRRQVHAKAVQPPRSTSGGDGGSGGAVQLLQSAWQAAVTPRTQRARAAAVKQLQSAWRGRVARRAAAARRASAYRAAAAARLAAARYKNRSLRVGAEDLMSVLNEVAALARLWLHVHPPSAHLPWQSLGQHTMPKAHTMPRLLAYPTRCACDRRSAARVGLTLTPTLTLTRSAARGGASRVRSASPR